MDIYWALNQTLANNRTRLIGVPTIGLPAVILLSFFVINNPTQLLSVAMNVWIAQRLAEKNPLWLHV